jgi:hypothetical protein
MASDSTQKRPTTWPQFRLANFLLLCIGGPAAAYLMYLVMPVMVWDGGFHVVMQLVSTSQRSIRSVEYIACFRTEEAAFTLRHPEVERPFPWPSAKFNAGQAECYVHSSGRQDVLGRELSYHYQRFVVLRIIYDDKTSAIQLVEIPRGDRTMTVTVP